MRAPLLEASHLELRAGSATELMTSNPVSVSETATMHEAMAMLIDKGFSAAPVIDEAGRPVGVISCSDLLVHNRETADQPRQDYTGQQAGYRVETADATLVRDLMTPTIFSVALDTPATRVVSDMLSLHVHRLFVVDERGALVGVISAMDIIRHLQPPAV